MAEQKNIAQCNKRKDILEKCLSDFKTNTGYDFCEILQDKNKFRSYVEEDKKKDLREYTEKSFDILDGVGKIYTDLVYR